ncbi:MAG: RsmB/NOP family class I SAM-dependent RNA methyltransferase [Rhodobacteraceae bacterium]|nr:RsmB/NOP family class I SAM-dependent RNA methyltransferase [Paracoccaceae bacterium]
MTPAARLQAAIEILDLILSGRPAEQALTGWARTHRFAGSKDRAAIRDHVFDCLRCQRSFAHLGGAETGRALILGLLRAKDQNAAEIFSGQGHAPAPLARPEAAHAPGPMPENVALDCPDWLAPDLRHSLGVDFAPVMQRLRQRAPVFLRVNPARASLQQAREVLARDQIDTKPHALAPTALEITGNARKLRQSAAFAEGLVELQDAASQAVIHALPDPAGLRVLDYCAGGGGKALALAALGAHVTAHDANPARMQDLPARAARAGARITLADAPRGTFDMVVTDVPCSGSGSWRRAPAGKWRLTPAGLEALCSSQTQILHDAAGRVRAGGWLCYMTCSMLRAENAAQIDTFLAAHPEFRLILQRQFTPLDGGDGFYLAVMQKLD